MVNASIPRCKLRLIDDTRNRQLYVSRINELEHDITG